MREDSGLPQRDVLLLLGRADGVRLDVQERVRRAGRDVPQVSFYSANSWTTLQTSTSFTDECNFFRLANEHNSDYSKVAITNEIASVIASFIPALILVDAEEGSGGETGHDILVE